MWRGNISWGSSIDTSPPDGMHKHETGAYFKTSSSNQPAADDDDDDDAEQQQQQRAAEVEVEAEAEPEVEIAAPPPPVASGQRDAPKRRQRRPSGIRFALKQQEAPSSNFRSRLSSISGALQKPRKLLSIGSSQSAGSAAAAAAATTTQTNVQITTTGAPESPERGRQADQLSAASSGDRDAESSSHLSDYEQQQRFLSSSSGRRLSQLFLPQVPPSAASLLAAGHDPYAAAVAGELLPSHLLGAGPGGGHRASWADASLFARLNHARASLDSSAAQRRHSMDSRKYPSDFSNGLSWFV